METVLVDAAPVTQRLQYALTPRPKLLRHHAIGDNLLLHYAFQDCIKLLIVLRVGAACLNEVVE